MNRQNISLDNECRCYSQCAHGPLEKIIHAGSHSGQVLQIRHFVHFHVMQSIARFGLMSRTNLCVL